MKKFLFIILIGALAGLFYNGVANFFFLPNEKILLTGNNKDKDALNNYLEDSQLPAPIAEKKFDSQNAFSKASLLGNISQFIQNPLISAEPKPVDKNYAKSAENDKIKKEVEDYLNLSSAINFPPKKVFEEAIIAKVKNNSEPLTSLILDLKNKLNALTLLMPPEELKEPHTSTIWLLNEFTELLEKINQKSSQEEIGKVWASYDKKFEEWQKVYDKTLDEIKFVAGKYSIKLTE